MVVTNEIYNKYVTEDLKVHKGLSHPVKSSVISRIRAKKVDPKKLHPNPFDEFSMDNIGPNWNIVGDYEKSIRQNIKKGVDIFEDPLTAVRLDKGGYMLLNGHHRWMAALNLRLKKIPIKLVNITQDEDIYKVINKSKRNKCVTIDFDEVLFSPEVWASQDEIPTLLRRVYKNNIRENASLLVREFQRMNYDVWIYTGSYLSEQYINGLFAINKCHVDGVVNGLNGKKNPQKLRDIFREKYSTIVHVDNEALTIVNTQNKKYEMIDINAVKDEWASSVITHINDFDMNSLNS